MDQPLDDSNRPPTPSFHPTAGVKIQPEEFHAIAAFAFPNSEVKSLRQLASGKSFNNRIYFATIQHPDQEVTQDIVLKVIGKYFGANKIQNEVACLQLLHRYCAHLPVPRVLAWSEDGSTAALPSEQGHTTSPLPSPPGVDRLEHGGWIMMSRVPGTPLDTEGLDDATLSHVATQLGDMVISIRRDVPLQKCCGNICLPLPAEGAELTIRDIIQEGITVKSPVHTANDYYRHKILGKLKELETSSTYAANRGLAPDIRAFVDQRLPKLSLRPRGETGFVLTHYDLAPRNVLVQGEPPQITGLVDFEFAGFFPTAEEFLNFEIGNKDDWSDGFWSAFLDHLEAENLATPRAGIEDDIWQTSLQLEGLVSGIAPWDLPGDLDDQQLAERLADAREQVTNMLTKLTDRT